MFDKIEITEKGKEFLIKALNSLETEEFKVIDLLYGLTTGVKKSLEETAAELNRKVEEVKRIQVDVLRKIRRFKG